MSVTYRGFGIPGHLHWDGIFSQNPPVSDLMRIEAGRKPDEIWVIQINPQERDGEPTKLDRSPRFLRELVRVGEKRADEFLQSL